MASATSIKPTDPEAATGLAWDAKPEPRPASEEERPAAAKVRPDPTHFPKATKIKRRLSLSGRFGGALLLGNLLGLILLVVAGLGMGAYRDGLLSANIEVVERQAVIARAALSSEKLAACGGTSCLDSPIPATVVLAEATDGFAGRVSVYREEGDGIRLVAESNDATAPAPAAVPIPAKLPALSMPSGVGEALSGWLDRLLFEMPIRQRISNETAHSEVAAILGNGTPSGLNLRYGPDGALVASVALPIVENGETRGVVLAESSGIALVSARIRGAILPIILVTFGAASFCALALTAAVTHPLRQLAGAADKVRSSVGRAQHVKLPDYDHRNDEVGQLSRSFRTMTEALVDRIESIDSFAADVSHELKNPLTSIRSAVETMEKCRTDEQRARLFNVIALDVDRMDRLISDISSASRLDAQLATEKRVALSASKLVGDVAGSYRAVTDAGGPRVNYWDETDGKLALFGAPAALGRVVRNLIDNAVSFSPPTGAVTVALEKDTSARQHVALITVSDEGPGVPKDNLESIFDRFYTSRPQGTTFGSNSGLGLAIARQIIESHGGRIWCENRPSDDPEFDTSPRGARFSIELPLHQGSYR